MRSRIAILVLALLALARAVGAESLCDHEAVLDTQGKLLPWTSYDHVVRGSVEYLVHCPTKWTAHGKDPWYLITSKLNEDGSFKYNQNNQGSNAYYAVDTLARYYAYSGDRRLFRVARTLLDRVLAYRTPKAWAWPGMPRTQDDTPDGEYTDETAEPEKMAMVGSALLRFHVLTGEHRYLEAAEAIGRMLAGKVGGGDENHSPLPFRVNLKTGVVLDPYTADMVPPVAFFDALARRGGGQATLFAERRDALWQWTRTFPLRNHRWSGYYEDVEMNPDNLNHQVPTETARFMMIHPEVVGDDTMRQNVPALLAWVRERYGQTKRFGATSIREQDCCFKEMSSHTSRYASVVAQWYGLSDNPADAEEALRSFALSTYSAFSKHSKDGRALNYVGVGYVNPWFSDSYFDYLPHILAGMAELPSMAPEDESHLLGSTSTIVEIRYGRDRIVYRAADAAGSEILRVGFTPNVLADGQVMDVSAWQYGEYRGASNVLRIRRANARNIVIGAR